MTAWLPMSVFTTWVANEKASAPVALIELVLTPDLPPWSETGALSAPRMESKIEPPSGLGSAENSGSSSSLTPALAEALSSAFRSATMPTPLMYSEWITCLAIKR